MNRRKALVTATSLVLAPRVLGQSPKAASDNPIRPAALQRTGRPALATYDAVKAVSDAKARELLPEVAEYYQHYGAHFAPSGLWSAESAASYTRFLQRSLRDRETGVLTLEQSAYLLTRKRCGRPDPSPGMAASDRLRWRYTDPTYWVDERIRTNLTREQWQKIIAAAWTAWQIVSTLTPKLSSSAKAANCLHASGEGRTDGFDGPSGVLAWAELPTNGGYTGNLLNRFDGSEQWTDQSDPRSIRALNVATHEIGHLLGLEHSSDPSALMAPFYDPDVPAPAADDIRRIKALYPKPNPSPTSPGGPTPPADPPTPPANPPTDPPDDPGPTDCPRGRGPRWFPALPRLFPRRRGVC